MIERAGEINHTLRRLLELEARLKELEESGDESEFSAGSNGGDSGMTAWQASVENRLASLDQRLEGLRSDMDSKFRWTWAGLAAGILMVLGAFAAGFLHLGAKIDSSVIGLIERLTIQ